MLTFPTELTILLSVVPIDMRRGIDSLTVLIVEQLKANPQDKVLFLFCNGQRDKVKALYWDRNGFTLIYKRLERKKFYIPRKFNGPQFEITHTQLKWLWAGFDFMALIKHPELTFTDYS